jgi:PAS domain S-box-containing protein
MNTYMNAWAFLPFSAFLTNAFLIFYGIARGAKTDLQRNYLKFMLTISLWSFFDFVNWNWSQLNEDWVMFIYHIQAPAYLFIGIYFLRFSYNLINKKEDWLYRNLIWLPLIFSVIAIFTGAMTKGYVDIWWGIMHVPGPLFIPATLICTVFPAQYAVILLLKSLKHTQNKIERQQRLLVFWGSAIILYISLMSDIIIPHVLGFTQAMQLAGASATILAIFMHRAVTKYNLLPINIKDTIEELFEHSNQGVLIVDEHKIIVDMNPTSNELLEMSKEKLLDKSISSIIKDDIFTQENHECEIILFSRDGDRHLHISATQHIRKSHSIGWVLIIRNVTSERMAHKKIKELNQGLEERVKIRTMELEESQQKLIQQTKDLERISKYKSEFMANMSHEIRTPMNGIMGFTDILLLEPELGDHEHESLSNIKKCSHQLLDLVNDILDFSKIEANCIALEKIHLDIGQLLLQSSEICRSRLDSTDKKVDILLDATSIKHLALGDPTRLKQVIINLLSNAIKFTSKGHIIMSAKCISETDDQMSIRIGVKDSGIGISEEQQKRIFNAFEQADGSTTRKYGGTGLGLTICKKLVSLMGGTLTVDSEAAQGSEFHFTLDFDKGDVLDDHEFDFSKEKIHYLENCPISRDLLKNSLGKTNGSFQSSEAELDNILQLKETTCDTLFVNLNNLDQRKTKVLCQQLNSFNKLPKVIAISSAKNSVTSEQSTKIGANKHITKPYYHLELCRQLANHAPITQRLKTVIELSEKHKILMVEDNPVNQKLQIKILKKMGHDVDLAVNGQVAVEMALKNNYELIFMDMQLPIMNGIEATKILRKEGINVPIIALTANAFESDKSRCLNAGMNDFISKPVNLVTFQNSLKKHFNKTVRNVQK